MSDTKPSTGAGYEVADAKAGTLVLYGVVLVLTVIFAAVASWLFFDLLAAQAVRTDSQPPALASGEPRPEPRLLDNEPQDLRSVREAERQILESYDWVDRSRGIVRIPIERALELVGKEGLPSRPTGGKAR
jgi:hypothetical protein